MLDLWDAISSVRCATVLWLVANVQQPAFCLNFRIWNVSDDFGRAFDGRWVKFKLLQLKPLPSWSLGYNSVRPDEFTPRLHSKDDAKSGGKTSSVVCEHGA
jgi:hypothetical protein